MPCTVIHGNADPLVNMSGGLATAAAIAGSRLVTIAGMGHDLPVQVWPQLLAEIRTTVTSGERRRDATAVECKATAVKSNATAVK